MLKGDLTSTPLAPLLRDLADDNATGCLHVTNPAGDEALIYFKTGLVYSATVPGTRPQLGAKLVSSGALAPEALAEALEAQRSELQGWRLGELLVHLGYVDQPVVEAFVREQVNEALWDLLRWVDGRWKFRKNIRAREDIGPPMVVVELLATLRDRGYEWENISAVVHGPAAVPVLSARGGGSAETTLDNDAWSMLCKIDGERSVADLARDCGYTLFEAGQVIVQLVQAGLVDIEEDVEIAGTELYGASTLTSALAGELDDDSDEASEPDDATAVVGNGRPTDAEKDDVLSRLARLVNEVAGDHSQDQASNGDRPGGSDLDDLHALEYEPASSVPAVALAPPHSSGVTSFENPMIVPLHRHSSESFASSIARVSNALSDVLGTTAEAEADAGSSPKPVALKRSRSSTSDPEWQRRKRLRSAAAAELASAQAMVETLRAETDGVDTPVEPVEPSAEQVADPDTEAVSDEQTEAERLAAEQAEAERVAAEEAQAQADQLAAEQAAEADRQEAERVAAEQAEAERVAAEQAEVERVAAEAAEVAAIEAAERAALEELAWADYWQREGEERAAAEGERVAAEQAEAERVAAEQAEAERLAAEAEAERLAAEEAEQRAAAEAEAERIAAEQAEAERIAAEEAEAERLAAEQAEIERLEAERAEAERIAAEEAEAERLAAEQAEIERLEAEEAERAAAEQAEIERLAAEQAEIERLEAEQAERAAAEQAEADRIAAEEAEQQAAAQAEADRIAAEEAERQAAEEAEQEQATRSASEEKAERAARRKADREEAEEAERQRDEAAAATAMLIELAASSQAEAAASAPVDAPVEEVAAEASSDEPESEPTEAWSEAGQADTAALLRELSSLGMDDDEPSAPAQQQRLRPNAVDKKTKKKIGLFGL